MYREEVEDHDLRHVIKRISELMSVISRIGFEKVYI